MFLNNFCANSSLRTFYNTKSLYCYGVNAFLITLSLTSDRHRFEVLSEVRFEVGLEAGFEVCFEVCLEVRFKVRFYVRFKVSF